MGSLHGSHFALSLANVYGVIAEIHATQGWEGRSLKTSRNATWVSGEPKRIVMLDFCTNHFRKLLALQLSNYEFSKCCRKDKSFTHPSYTSSDSMYSQRKSHRPQKAQHTRAKVQTKSICLFSGCCQPNENRFSSCLNLSWLHHNNLVMRLMPP